MKVEGMDYKMRKLYEDVELELKKVNYNDLWTGFSRKEFALYNKVKIFLKNEEIPYDNRFLGNTSIDYNGENLAIWHVEDPNKVDSRELASNIIHEMFHSYQLSNGEKRFPNDLKGLDYPIDLKNFEIKYRENMLLIQALDSNNRDLKNNLLKEIISLRMSRLQRYGDIIKYEFAVETVEGSAEYCGTKALKFISEELYEKRIEEYKNILSTNTSSLFDIRMISYYTGVLLLILFEDLNIDFIKEIIGQSQSIFEEVAEKIGYSIIDIENVFDPRIEENFRTHVDNLDKRFEDFFNKPLIKHEGDFVICGYDPMNMVKLRDMILCDNFIMLIDRKFQEKIFLKGPIVVKVKNGTSNQVTGYYSRKSL